MPFSSGQNILDPIPLIVPKGVAAHPSAQNQLTFYDLEGSVRSWARRHAGCDREHDLIEAGLNEAAGCFCAMEKVATACWRDYSDDGRATDAKRCFGEEDLGGSSL